jgi:siroheme decarboxylase
MINDSIDRNIIAMLQGDIPLQSHPFRELAQVLAITEEDIVERIKAMRQQGYLRRWGAVLRHRQAGYVANAMVAWKVTPERADQAGQVMAEFKEISHCYLRQVPASFAYNLFAMMHARTEAELIELVAKVSARSGLEDYVVIRSNRELKKASMRYI